jgi:UDPglucose 6-dehydrogenase
VQALIKTAKDYGYTPRLLNATEDVNKDQKKIISQKITAKFGEDLSKFTFALWGLSFKPETDDMREATSITVINELLSKGAKIKAYDPKAMEEAKNFYFKDAAAIEYKDSKYSVLTDCDALILLTEWKEFRSPDFDEIKKRLKNPIIFDGRNQYSKDKLKEIAIEYYQIGVR